MKRNLFTLLLSFILLSGMAQRTAVVDHRTSVDMNPSFVRPAFEDMAVYRIQLRISTGTGTDAGTDDDVYVQLNNNDGKFFLVQGIDNFEQGKTVTYDVLSQNITTIRDLEFLQLGIKGNDGLCLKKIELIINNCSSPLFSKTYAAAKGLCIDNNTNQPHLLKIAGTELRNGGTWNYDGARLNLWRPPSKISRDWIISIVEAAIGDQINQADKQDFQWGTVGNRLENKTLWGKAVEITKIKDGHTLEFDLDLENTVNGPNPEIDVDFDLDFRCEEGKILFETRNVKVNTDIIGDIQNYLRDKGIKMIGTAIGGAVAGPSGAAAGGVASGYVSKALAINMKLDPKTPNASVTCSQILVTSAGDILLR